jgi:hypothetical protein
MPVAPSESGELAPTAYVSTPLRDFFRLQPSMLSSVLLVGVVHCIHEQSYTFLSCLKLGWSPRFGILHLEAHHLAGM